MAIQNVGSINDVLGRYDAKAWTKSMDMEGVTRLDVPEFSPMGKKQKTFGEMLATSIAGVNDLQMEANESIQKLMTGESKNIHETMLAVEKADIAFKTMNQVRLKVIDAYREIMKMQV